MKLVTEPFKVQKRNYQELLAHANELYFTLEELISACHRPAKNSTPLIERAVKLLMSLEETEIGAPNYRDPA